MEIAKSAGKAKTTAFGASRAAAVAAPARARAGRGEADGGVAEREGGRGEALDQQADEGRDDRPRQEADQGDDADPGRAVRLEAVDPEGNREGPGGERDSRRRDAEKRHVAVPEVLRKRPRAGLQSRQRARTHPAWKIARCS